MDTKQIVNNIENASFIATCGGAVLSAAPVITTVAITFSKKILIGVIVDLAIKILTLGCVGAPASLTMGVTIVQVPLLWTISIISAQVFLPITLLALTIFAATQGYKFHKGQEHYFAKWFNQYESFSST